MIGVGLSSGCTGPAEFRKARRTSLSPCEGGEVAPGEGLGLAKSGLSRPGVDGYPAHGRAPTSVQNLQPHRRPAERAVECLPPNSLILLVPPPRLERGTPRSTIWCSYSYFSRFWGQNDVELWKSCGKRTKTVENALKIAQKMTPKLTPFVR